MGADGPDPKRKLDFDFDAICDDDLFFVFDRHGDSSASATVADDNGGVFVERKNSNVTVGDPDGLAHAPVSARGRRTGVIELLSSDDESTVPKTREDGISGDSKIPAFGTAGSKAHASTENEVVDFFASELRTVKEAIDLTSDNEAGDSKMPAVDGGGDRDDHAERAYDYDTDDDLPDPSPFHDAFVASNKRHEIMRRLQRVEWGLKIRDLFDYDTCPTDIDRRLRNAEARVGISFAAGFGSEERRLSHLEGLLSD